MAWMAGSMRAILAVLLLGCSQNLLDDSSESYGRAKPGQTGQYVHIVANGDTVTHEHRAGENARQAAIAAERDLAAGTPRAEVREAVMAGVVVVAVAVFLGGMVLGVIAVIAISVRREDRHYTLAGAAPDRLSRNTRRLTGLARRDLDADFLRPGKELVR